MQLETGINKDKNIDNHSIDILENIIDRCEFHMQPKCYKDDQ